MWWFMSVCNDAAETCDSDIDSTLFVFFNGDCELLYATFRLNWIDDMY